MQVIYSDLFMGAGIVAGGPYGCIQSLPLYVIEAEQCLKFGSKLNMETIESFVTKEEPHIDSPSNLSGKPMWIFSGTFDSVVFQTVVDRTVEFF